MTSNIPLDVVQAAADAATFIAEDENSERLGLEVTNTVRYLVRCPVAVPQICLQALIKM